MKYVGEGNGKSRRGRTEQFIELTEKRPATLPGVFDVLYAADTIAQVEIRIAAIDANMAPRIEYYILQFVLPGAL